MTHPNIEMIKFQMFLFNLYSSFVNSTCYNLFLKFSWRKLKIMSQSNRELLIKKWLLIYQNLKKEE